jgi:hypothetical protein
MLMIRRAMAAGGIFVTGTHRGKVKEQVTGRYVWSGPGVPYN